MAVILQDAYLAAQAHLDAHVRPGQLAEVAICSCEEHESAWVFGYNTRPFIEQDSLSDSLVGNGPVVVPRDGSPTWLAWSGLPVDQQL